MGTQTNGKNTKEGHVHLPILYIFKEYCRSSVVYLCEVDLGDYLPFLASFSDIFKGHAFARMIMIYDRGLGLVILAKYFPTLNSRI